VELHRPGVDLHLVAVLLAILSLLLGVLLLLVAGLLLAALERLGNFGDTSLGTGLTGASSRRLLRGRSRGGATLREQPGRLLDDVEGPVRSDGPVAEEDNEDLASVGGARDEVSGVDD